MKKQKTARIQRTLDSDQLPLVLGGSVEGEGEEEGEEHGTG